MKLWLTTSWHSFPVAAAAMTQEEDVAFRKLLEALSGRGNFGTSKGNHRIARKLGRYAGAVAHGHEIQRHKHGGGCKWSLRPTNAPDTLLPAAPDQVKRDRIPAFLKAWHQATQAFNRRGLTPQEAVKIVKRTPGLAPLLVAFLKEVGSPATSERMRSWLTKSMGHNFGSSRTMRSYTAPTQADFLTKRKRGPQKHPRYVEHYGID